MSPGVHLLTGWVISEVADLPQRNRNVIAYSAVVSDLDGLGILIDILTGATSFYAQYHHVVGHGIFFSIATAIVAALISKQNIIATIALSILSFHSHLLLDVIGSGGPQGEIWPIYYFWPLYDASYEWSGQWALNSWRNFAYAAVIFFITFELCKRRRRTPFLLFSKRMDAACLGMILGKSV